VGLKRGTTSNPKFRALIRRLELTPWGAVGVLESLWIFTASYARAGDVGRWTDQEIADGIGWTEDAAELVAGLVETRWLDVDEVHRLLIHDWPDHADGACVRALKRDDARRRGVQEREGNPRFARPGEPLEPPGVTMSRHDRTKADPPSPSPSPSPSPAPRTSRPPAGDPTSSSNEGTGTAVELRRLFVRSLLESDPKHSIGRKTNFTAWDRDLERLVRIDGRTPGEIRAMIAWAAADSFWSAVIQSPKKLRSKWDQMAAQRRRTEPAPSSSPRPERPSIDEELDANPSDRRVLNDAGTLIDPEAGEDHVGALRKARSRFPALGRRSPRQVASA
jgi:hypothetical protein